MAATYNCVTRDGKFLAIGSAYSYITGGYEFGYHTIDPQMVMDTQGVSGVTQTLPGSLLHDFQQMEQPYGIYVNPYTGYIYGTDANNFADGGSLYQWSPEGTLQSKHKVYINPAHFLALPPNGHFTGIDKIRSMVAPKGDIYDLQGRRIAHPQKGIYVRDGHKYIMR